MVGTGEGPLFIAEKFALHQVFRNRCTVDCHKRLVPSVTGLMDHAGDEFLAGAVFPLQ